MDLSRLKIDRSPPPSRRGRRKGGAWFGRLLFIAAVAVAVWLFRAPLQRVADRVRLPEVATLPVARSKQVTQSALSGISANGHIVARVRAALSADTPGRIVELNVEEGQSVAEGFVVARLYADELQAALDRAKADLHAAEASVARAETEVASADAEIARLDEALRSREASLEESQARQKQAELDVTRIEKLVADGFETADRLDNARTERVASAARVLAAQADVRTAAAEVAEARARREQRVASVAETAAQIDVMQAAVAAASATLDKTVIRAPFDGVVVLKDAEVGEVVSPNSQAGSNARGSVATMVDFESLEVQAEVPETNLAAVEIGGPARVFLDAFPETGFDAVVSRIWPTANRQKATVEVRIRLAEIDPRMRPEMGVRVVFLGDDAASGESVTDGDAGRDTVEAMAIVIPSRSLVRIDGVDCVFVLERDRVQKREVAIGPRTPTNVAISSGLEEGERIVIDPPASLKDGDRVRPRSER